MGKEEQRLEAIAQRRAIPVADRVEAAKAIAAHVLAQPIIAQSSRVAAYVSMRSEPGTGPTIAGLLDRGIEVIVPISLEDGSLDWVVYSPEAAVMSTSLGISEPDGDRLGAQALSTADFVIVPALAVDVAGNRLGRGAGYYDRSLGYANAPLCALLFAGEIADAVPHEGHDIPMNMVVTPTGVFRVP
ncbi:MAG: 5-formyltetrahydrofolate cyclo-ligase [Actinomycetota bacterium]|nr:5-formyltetrahydrofolate cyclo-ligase [Actinomycetota bacterium]